ncbi:MAG TPA: hypothetical protein VGN75_16720 [Kaistia sp.]|jgi:hypothetical protein|nr:hypothetical protein [Kaistia sp.]
MNIVKLNDDLSEIDGKVRVERGPARKTGKATEALLSDDRTLSHYQVGALDAAGQPIVLGKTMAYLDWLADKGFYVFGLAEPTEEFPNGQWIEDSFHEEETAAFARAAELATL